MAKRIVERLDDTAHDGGAWKVAYADFVTALMALFIVLWLLNANKQVRQAISQYFKDPANKGAKLPVAAIAPRFGGSGVALRVNTENVSQLQQRLKDAIHSLPQFKKFGSFVQIMITNEGLRIELTENEGGMFFETGSPKPTTRGDTLFRLLAAEMGKLPNDVAIEGHTDSRAFKSETLESYGNWELSFDRANMARRIMLANGLHTDQISEIRGYGDRRHLIPANPMDSRNRRVSVILKYAKE